MQPTPPPERENVPSLKLLLVGLAAIAIGVAAVVVTWLLQQEWQQARARAPIPRLVGSPEIARVNQETFALYDRYERLWQHQQRRLHSYGWVDREARLIHVPLERALELVLREQEGAR
jgi:hypothetical protein